MKRTLVVAVVLTAFCVTLAFAQAGPKREEKKPKADSTAVEKPAQPEEAEKAEKAEKVEKVEKVKKIEKVKKVEKAQKAEKPEKPENPEEAMVPRKAEHVPRAVFATAIAEREPVGKVDTLSTAVDSVYFFTALVGLEGQTVTHRWTYGGEVLAEVPIAVGAPHWRAYSKKRLLPAWTGEWTVEVVGAGGAVLARRSFVYAAD